MNPYGESIAPNDSKIASTIQHDLVESGSKTERGDKDTAQCKFTNKATKRHEKLQRKAMKNPNVQRVSQLQKRLDIAPKLLLQRKGLPVINERVYQKKAKKEDCPICRSGKKEKTTTLLKK